MCTEEENCLIDLERESDCIITMNLSFDVNL